jgi:aminopeptidase N
MIVLLRYSLLIATILFITYTNSYAQSGGVLSPKQAAYDVNYYDLDLKINPTEKTINGSLLCRVEIIDPIDTLVLDLDSPFTVDSVLFKIENADFSNVAFSHTNKKLYITIPMLVTSGDMVTAQIFYYGAPHIATNPPWGDGFVWDHTSTGEPWVGVTSEFNGADIWWPCKDHPSDEPDSMSLSFTVPDPLICVSNGRYLGSTDNGNNTTTFDWFISTPINNYNVTLYAAEYSLIEDNYLSVSGDTIPFYFWVLPEDYETAVNHMDVFLTEFNFHESICGPFPFGTDKHGWAHASYWGMEHQTIIAYGHNFTVNNWGYDYIHYHELAHEWWGNLITAKDWSDVWIHEGIATYTQALYVEHLSGMDSYHQYMDLGRPNNNHTHPLAPYEELTASEAFNNLNPYSRGAAVMHTLRYHLGDEVFFNLFKRWLYPDSTDYDNTNGRLCQILTTDDMKENAEEITGVDLDPFFDVFFREAAYPDLHVLREINETTFTWETENDVLLDVNIPILVNGTDQTVEMINGQGSLAISISDTLVIDPKKWILMATPSIVTSVEDDITKITGYQLEQNYPNPFSLTTTIKFSIPKSQFVTLKIFDVLGNEIITLVNGKQAPGIYEVEFDGSNLKSGEYFYRLQAGDYSETKRFVFNK